MTLLLSESCLFVIRMEDSFDFHVGKRVASHLFDCDMSEIISKIVAGHPLNSCQDNLAGDWLDLTCSLKRGNIFFFVGSLNKEGV